MAQDLPKRIGAYHVLAELHRGEETQIFRARTSVAASVVQIVALKVLRAQYAMRGPHVRRFMRELRIAGWLNHPNIAQLFDVGEYRGRYFAAMELVGGMDLKALLQRGWVPSTPAALSIIHQLSQALGYLHTVPGPDRRPLCLIHRDVAADNVIIADGGRVALIDFGSVTSARGEISQSAIPRVRSSTAPEVQEGVRVDATADVYGLGVLLAELVKTRADSDVGALLDRALHSDPLHRFRSAADMRSAIEAVARVRDWDVSRAALGREIAGVLTGQLAIDGRRMRRNTDADRGRRRAEDVSDQALSGLGCDPLTFA